MPSNSDTSIGVSILPQELVTTTFQYVSVIGLNVQNNATHRAIWDALVTNRRSDRLPLYYQAVTADSNLFPKPKPKVKNCRNLRLYYGKAKSICKPNFDFYYH